MTAAHTCIVFLFAAALLPLQARAAEFPSPGAVSHVGQIAAEHDGENESENDEDTQGKDRGVLQGNIIGIDYARGILHVQSARQGRMDIQILPSTSIVRRGEQYGTIADLTSGTHVWLYLNEVAGRLTAQIIRIR